MLSDTGVVPWEQERDNCPP